MHDGGTMMDIRNFDTKLVADPSHVVLRPFSISATPKRSAFGMMTRAERIALTVMKLSEEECIAYLDRQV